LHTPEVDRGLFFKKVHEIIGKEGRKETRTKLHGRAVQSKA